MYYLATYYSYNILKQLDYVPAISEFIISDVRPQIENNGVWLSLLEGIATGVPYKIYAAWAGHMNISLTSFIAARSG